MPKEDLDLKKDLVLVIEDNLFMSELLSEKIKRQGFQTIVVATGKDALNVIEKERFALVLLDLPLAGEMDGFEVLKKVREKHDQKDLPVITLFNLDDPQSMEKSLSLGANDYIVKAFTTTDEMMVRIVDLVRNKVSKKDTKNRAVFPGVGTAKNPIKNVIHAPTIRQEMTQVPHIKERIEKALTQPAAEVSIIALMDLSLIHI